MTGFGSAPQRALLTHITPSMRAVSVEVRPAHPVAWMRFVFDGEPSADAREVASCAHTELVTDFVDEWPVELELVACPAPGHMEHRRWLVYHRCEDAWVQDAEPGAQADHRPPLGDHAS